MKTPVPPRTWVVRLPVTSQLKPTRGDQRILASGSFAVWYWTGLPSASRKVSASAFAFWKPVSPKDEHVERARRRSP